LKITKFWFLFFSFIVAAFFFAPVSLLDAQQVDPSLFSSLRWRLLGSMRGGRVSAVSGIPTDPTTYYMGTPGGGVWKSTDSGEVWKPIFDDAHVASIGAIAVARSNPNIIYVGTGEQTDGNGVWKSTDAGATWAHMGLEDTHYITSVIIDPHNPDIVIVGAFGHPILSASAPSPAKGIYKSSDGGKSWQKTLYKDDMTGVQDLAVDPDNPRILYAVLWHPFDWRSGAMPGKEQDAFIYKSTDEGSSWMPVGTNGLPTETWGRTGIAVAPGSHGQRVFAILVEGLYRSDDGGAAWRKITADPRIQGNPYFSRVFVDPTNADTVYVLETAAYRSTDGGETFVAFKGAPGGDDYHVMWIDPENSKRMILGVDQGAILSVDNGSSWTSWYNQPTGQLYHVITDNQFPYISYAPQQDSGTIAVPHRGDFGEITYRDWFSIGGFEFCHIAPDPLHLHVVYSGGWYGSVVRFDKTTGQITTVFVRSAKYHTSLMAPLVFSPQNPRTLYYGTQYLMKSANDGDSWQILSPDLTVRPGGEKSASGSSAGHIPYELGEAEEDKDFEQSGRRGPALNVLAPSQLREGVIWAGTTNGLIQLTRDGGNSWQNVSPADLTDKSSIEAIDPSHFELNSAYAAVITSHDPHPYIYRTHDGGKSWQKIVNGLPDSWNTWVVREDPRQEKLLYAGNEEGVYVSFDDGDHWQSLELNLPAATVRDLVIHGDDVVIATYGRGLWVLDNISPLRDAFPKGGPSAVASMIARAADLLPPEDAIRVRWDNDQETPLPPEFPSTPNPLDGAVFDYYLGKIPSGDISLDILNPQGRLVRHFSSVPGQEKYLPANVPDYWFGIQETLTKNRGMNRFAWDLRYPPPPMLPFGYFGEMLDYTEYTLSNHAIPGQTPRQQSLGAMVPPGPYQAVLTVNGQKYTRNFNVVIDPRVSASQSDLVEQFRTAQSLSAGLVASTSQFEAAEALRIAVEEREKKLEGNSGAREARDALKDVSAKIDTVEGGRAAADGLGPANRELARILFMVEAGDAAPSDSAKEAAADSCAEVNKAMSQWQDLNAVTLPGVNAQLRKFQLEPLPTAASQSLPTDACAAP
jgi:photosystem II stability/assembly factor-like uncharacterized protein